MPRKNRNEGLPLTPVARENLEKLMAHILGQFKTRSKKSVGARPLSTRLAEICMYYGVTGVPSDTTLRRWSNAKVVDSQDGAGKFGPGVEESGKMAIALQIYPADEIKQYDLAEIGQIERLINNAGLYFQKLLNTKGGLDEWLNSDVAQTWLDGPVQLTESGRPPQVFSPPDKWDLEYVSADVLRDGISRFAEQLYLRTTNSAIDEVEEMEPVKKSHLAGDIMAALITEGTATLESIHSTFQLVSDTSLEALQEIIYEGRLMNPDQCKAAAILLNKPLPWFVEVGACESTASVNDGNAIANGDV